MNTPLMKKPIIFYLSFLLLICFTLTLSAQPMRYPVRVADKWGYANRAGELMIPARYDQVQNFAPNGLAIVQEGKKVGVIDSTGRHLLPSVYDFADTFSMVQRLFIVRKEGVWQLRDDTDKLIVDNISGEAGIRAMRYIVVTNEFGVGLVHLDFGAIIAADTMFTNFEPVNMDYILIRGNSGTSGLLHRTRGIILPPIYQNVSFKGDMVFVKKDYKWAVFDTLGKPRSGFLFPEVSRLSADIVLAKDVERSLLYDCVSQKTIYNNLDNAYFLGDWIVVTRNNLEGVLSLQGKEILPIAYQKISNWFSFVRAKKDDKDGLYTAQGEAILPHEYMDFLPFDSLRTIRILADNNRWGVYDIENRKLTAKAEYSSIDSLNYSVALAQGNNNTAVLNRLGQVVLKLPPTDSIKEFALNNNILSMLTSTGGKKIIPFDEAGQPQESTEYTKYQKLRIRPSASNVNNNNNNRPTTPTNSMQINDRHYWSLHEKTNRWGLRDTIDHKWKVPPTYIKIERYPQHGFTLVYKNSIELEVQLDKITYKYTNAFGVFSDKHAILVGKVEFIGLNLSDFAKSDVATCVFSNGFHGLLHKSGKILARDYPFVGKIVDGRARVAVAGVISAHIAPDKRYDPIMLLQKYKDLITVPCADFSGYTGGNYMEQMTKSGQVHCQDCKWGLIDTFGKVLLKPQHQFIEDFYLGSASYKSNNQWGLLDLGGNPLLKAQFGKLEFLPNSNQELYFISRPDEKYGAIDSNAHLVVAMEYQRMRDAQGGYIAVCQNSRWGFIDIAKKDTLIGCHFNSVHDFSENVAAVLVSGRWGFINESGKMAIRADYSQCGDFHEGKAWVRLKAGKMGYIDKTGTVVITGDFRKLGDFKNGVAVAADMNHDFGLIDEQGNWLFKPNKNFSQIEILDHKGLAIAKVGSKKVLINFQGKQLSQHCAVIRPFSDGIAIVRKNPLSNNQLVESDWGFIDTTGQLIGKFKYHRLGDFYDGRAKAYDSGKTNKWGYINRKGDFAIAPIYQTAEDFKAARAIVTLKYNSSGLVDTAGKYLMQPNHKTIIDNEHKICLVRNSYNNYHFISEDLRRLTAQNFTDAHPFRNGVAPVQHGGAWGLLNEQGLFILSPKYQRMYPVSNGFARVGIENRLGVANTRGEIIIPPDYDYIQYVGNNIFRVEKGDIVEYLDSKGSFIWRQK
jgi:hypothetical protein